MKDIKQSEIDNEKNKQLIEFDWHSVTNKLETNENVYHVLGWCFVFGYFK